MSALLTSNQVLGCRSWSGGVIEANLTLTELFILSSLLFDTRSYAYKILMSFLLLHDFYSGVIAERSDLSEASSFVISLIARSE